MRQLTIEGRITVLKSLNDSKVIHLLLITKLHNDTTDPLFRILYLARKKTKIKLSTLCNG